MKTALTFGSSGLFGGQLLNVIFQNHDPKTIFESNELNEIGKLI